FQRVEGQAGRSFEGSGIGLALVQELVRLHGGHVEVESEVGRGSDFTVEIPLGRDHLPAERVRDRPDDASPDRARAQAFVDEALRWLPASAADAAPAALGGDAIYDGASRPLVLLADDNADMRDYVSRLLTSRYEVEAVGDGRSALEAARARRP